jgi:hypothetical protein
MTAPQATDKDLFVCRDGWAHLIIPSPHGQICNKCRGYLDELVEAWKNTALKELRDQHDAAISGLNKEIRILKAQLKTERPKRGPHGLTHTPIYKVWANMKQRCTNPKNKNYADYGGRGIQVCERWMSSFKAFYEDFGKDWLPGLTIERIDNDGSYEPGNVRWATMREQRQNMRPDKLSSTGHRYVYRNSKDGYYKVARKENGKNVHYGNFKTLEAAVERASAIHAELEKL